MKFKEKTNKERNRKLIDTLEISDIQKELIKSTWFDYLYLTDRNARFRVNWFHVLQILVIICGLLIPVLETTPLDINFMGSGIGLVGILGLIVAMATGINRHFSFEEKWRHYRQHAEMMRNEGDDFFALSNRYSNYSTHQDAFKDFIATVTNFKRMEIQSYMTKMDDDKNTDPTNKNKQPQ